MPSTQPNYRVAVDDGDSHGGNAPGTVVVVFVCVSCAEPKEARVEFDPLALFTNVSPAMAFGILAFWFNRRDHADMLRREQAFSAQLAAIVQQQLGDSEKRTESLTLLERRIHDQNSILQRIEARLDPRLRGRESRKEDDGT